jgi:lia operon protein LiaG
MRLPILFLLVASACAAARAPTPQATPVVEAGAPGTARGRPVAATASAPAADARAPTPAGGVSAGGVAEGGVSAGGLSQGALEEWAIRGDRIVVTNLAGRVTVGYAAGDRIVVRAERRGRDAGRLAFRVEEGGQAEFHVVYPLSEHRRYVYPELGSGSRTVLQEWPPKEEVSGLRALLQLLTGRGIEIRGRPSGGALEAWADVEVLLPAGTPARVVLGAGPIEAAGVRAPLALRTRTGRVAVRDVTGDLDVDTGSGSVRVQGVRGSVRVDTGSGSVDVREVEAPDGELYVDTGSGRVLGDRVRARRVTIDTGSGSVDVTRVKADGVRVDTGSGSVAISEMDAAEVRVDTGSGSVTLDFAHLGPGRVFVDTGSGGVTLRLPRDASARVRASTGSGGIAVDLPGVRLVTMSRREAVFEVGDGRTPVELETGSGGIRIVERR